MAAENRRDSGNQNSVQRNSSWLERHFSYIRPHSGKSLLEAQFFFNLIENEYIRQRLSFLIFYLMNSLDLGSMVRTCYFQYQARNRRFEKFCRTNEHF
jgi:hypothetical protein